ncbi:MAG: VCBS repeat-containing protein [Candidatus Hydrogenedentes bacterium]|nr:VCBS repeat-containing protein [Candidatus Hydrogenedentota bacterium]
MDGDDDFVFRPHYTESAYVMRNLGTSGAFYPGGAREVSMLPPLIGGVRVNLDVVMDFEDVTGDGRPDMLAAAYKTGAVEETYVVWYSNTGSAFQYRGLLYTSPQHALAELALTLADINGDGLQDVFFMEPFLSASERPHRVFLMLNTGTSTEPAWGTPVEIEELSSLLPPLMSGAKAAMPQKAGTESVPVFCLCIIRCHIYGSVYLAVRDEDVNARAGRFGRGCGGGLGRLG